MDPKEASNITKTPSSAEDMPMESSGHTSHKKGSYLSRNTTILILVLAAFALFFLFIALNPRWNKNQQQVNLPITTPTPAYVQSVLTLDPSTTSIAKGTKAYDINIESHANTINAVQVELSYDPKMLTNVAIVPGTFFTRPVILIKNIDSQNGRISYALGIQPVDTGIKGKGTVATITFSVAAGSTGTTKISFLPKTFVAAQGITPSVLKQAVGATISLSPQPSTTSQ